MKQAPDSEQYVVVLGAMAAAQVDADPAEVTSQTDLFTDLGFDSLDAAEFVMEIEDRFDVCIPSDVADKVRTVRQVADMLHAALHPDVAAAADG